MLSKRRIHYSCEGRIEKSVPQDHSLSSLGRPCDAKRGSSGQISPSYPHSHYILILYLICSPIIKVPKWHGLSHLLFQGDMLVSIVLQYKLRGDQVDCFTCMWLNLGFPLVAKLQLWRSPQGFVPQGREAVEQTEDSESLSSM